MIAPDPEAALRIPFLLALGEELDGAIEFTRSLVDVALDIGDLDWAAKAGRTYHLLRALRAVGIGGARVWYPPAQPGEGLAAA